MKTSNSSYRLWQLTFRYKIIIIFSCLFSILSVAAAFIPFISVYYIVYEIVSALVNHQLLNSELVINYGWLAFIAAASSIFFNFLALCFSHIAAFKTLYHLKYNFVRYLSCLPLGFYSSHSSGELRKIVDDDIEKIEIFIAHQLPDINYFSLFRLAFRISNVSTNYFSLYCVNQRLPSQRYQKQYARVSKATC